MEDEPRWGALREESVGLRLGGEEPYGSRSLRWQTVRLRGGTVQLVVIGKAYGYIGRTV